ncbi:hypothetical protein ACQRBF_04205 [Peptoniphilaceae bacterium SGI.131]
MKKKYLDKVKEYTFYTFFYKRFLEEEYIKDFGSLQIKKMENIYESMVMDRKLEDSFIYGHMARPYQDQLSSFTARKELVDLENQIKILKDRLNKNRKSLDELKQVLAYDDFFSKLERVTLKTSPVFSRDKRANFMFESLYKALEKKDFSVIDRFYNKLDLFDNEDYFDKELAELQIRNMEESLEKTLSLFPYSQEDMLTNRRAKSSKMKEVKGDIESSGENLTRLRNIYLHISSGSQFDN